MSGLIDRSRRLLPGVWLGLLLGVAALATPAPFAQLQPADAGRVVARVLAGEAWFSLAFGVLLLLLENRTAQQRAEAGGSRRLSAAMLLVFGALFCTVAGYFGVQPQLASARSGQSPLSFGQWHAVSMFFFALKAVLVAAHAWLAASMATLASPSPSSSG